MVELFNFCFSDGYKEFIGIAKCDAIRTNKQQKHRLSFNKTSSTQLFSCQSQFCIFINGSCFFSRKMVPAKGARTFCDIFRFIDELCALINDEFKNNFNDIYAHAMSLNSRRRMMIFVKPRFRTFSIDDHDRKFTLSYLIKRDAFSYHQQCFVLRSVLKFYMFPGQ